MDHLLAPWHRARENRFENALGHSRSKVSSTRAEHESFHTNFLKLKLSFMLKNHESGSPGVFDVWELFLDLKMFQRILVCVILRNGMGITCFSCL